MKQGAERSIRAEHRDDEEIQWYVAQGHDMVSRSTLGAQLEALRDQVSGSRSVGVDRDPTWLLDFGRSSAIHRARRTAVVLWGAAELHGLAVPVLWAYCHPTTVTACDGLYGTAGRLLGLLPLTPTGQVATRGARLLVSREAKGGDVLSVHGALRAMNAARCQSKGEERQAWSAMLREARALRDASFGAYQVARRFVARFEREFGLMPNRAELSGGVTALAAEQAAEAEKTAAVPPTQARTGGA